MHCFEVLLELVQLGPQLFTLRLDACKALLRISEGVNGVFALHFFDFVAITAAKICQVLSRESATAIRTFRLYLLHRVANTAFTLP